MRTIFRALAGAVLFAALASPSLAQHLGDVSLSQANQKLFAGQTTAAATPVWNINCVPTNGSPCGIPNQGQSIHAITYTISSPCNTGFFMDLRMEATNDGSTWFGISEDATDQNSGSVQGSTVGGLTAIGSYAGFRLNLVALSCASGQTPAVTAFYSGTSASNPTSVGAFYQASPIRKVVLSNQATTNAVTQPAITINAPNGNTAGGIYVSCYIAANGATTSCPAGMTITLTSFIAFGSAIGGGGGGNIVSSTNTFSVANTVAPVIQVINAPAISMTFSFGGAGTAGVNWTIFYIATSTPTSPFASDPCLSSGSAKLSAPISFSTATTTQIVGLVSGQKIYPCGVMLTANADSSGIFTFQWEYGTGASCGTGTTTLSGPLKQNSTNANNSYGFNGGTFLNVPSSQALCIVTVQISGAVINLNGVLSYIQQ